VTAVRAARLLLRMPTHRFVAIAASAAALALFAGTATAHAASLVF